MVRSAPIRRRLSITLAACALCWTVFGVSVWWIPFSEHSSSTLASGLYRRVYIDTNRRARATGSLVSTSHTRWYHRTANGFVSCPEPSEQIDGRDPDVVAVDLHIWMPGESGWWAPTRSVTHYTVFLDGVAADPLAATTLRAQFIDDLHTEGVPEVASHAQTLRVKDLSTRKAYWPGWLHNAISAASLAFGVFLLARVPRRLREEYRRRRNLCPRCAYDLHATPATSPCPECGRPAMESHR